MKTKCVKFFLGIRKSYFLSIYYLFIFLSAHISYSDDQAIIRQLLSKPMRPTVGEYLEAFGMALPDHNPIPKKYSVDKINSVMTDGIDLILKLESVFPQLTYAPLGRDSAAFADVLEAFYLSIGMKNRVIRIHASTPSFFNGNELQILEASGLIDLTGQPTQDFVILDPTSWQPHSQSRRLLTSVYSAFKGSDPYSTLKNRIGAVSVPTTNITTQHVPIIIGTQHDSFFEYIQEHKSYNYILSSGYNALSYPSLVNGEELQWHGKYQPPTIQMDGHSLPTPGLLMSEDFRKRILWWLYEVIQMVQSDHFQHKIKKLSTKAGLEWNMDSLNKFFNVALLQEFWSIDKYAQWLSNYEQNFSTKSYPTQIKKKLTTHKLKWDLFLYLYGDISLELHDQLFQALRTEKQIDTSDFLINMRIWAEPLLNKMNKIYTEENILEWSKKLPADLQERIFYMNHFLYSATVTDLNTSWLSLCLRSESSREVFSAVLKDLYQNPSKLSQSINFQLFMAAVIDIYWNLETERPFTVQEINHLVGFMPLNSPLHIQFIIKSFSKLTMRTDYAVLQLPSQASVANNSLYQHAKQLFKKQHPLPKSEKPWWQRLRSIMTPRRNMTGNVPAAEATQIK